LPQAPFSITTQTDDRLVQSAGATYPPALTEYFSGGTTIGIRKRFDAGSGSPHVVDIGLLRFDTSTLADDTDVLSAFLRVWVTQVLNGDSRSLTADFYQCLGTNPAIDFTLNDLSGAIEPVGLGTFTVGADNDIPLLNVAENVNPQGYAYLERVVFALNVAVAPAIPVAIGIAILRYRLYEIDTFINRTLVYGTLTATLAAVYLGGVAIIQSIFRALTSQQEQPQLAIVVSTLVIAALFNPLRRRIQGFIDRRFYRSKYYARKTLEAYSATLREETDLEALGDDLTGMVRETMQPAHVSLWLRPDTPRKGEQAN
jgi:hypothetical protein